MDIVLFGIQGSGKGTQAKKLAADFGFDIFEAGGELRRIAASGTELGETVKGYIDAGHLVPHQIIMQVVREAIAAKDPSTKILFDGIPRDFDQQRDFDVIMQEAGRNFRCVELHVNEAASMERLKKRATEQGRADDAKEEAILRRISVFHEKTEPVIDLYRSQGKVIDVDGDETEQAVYDRLVSALGF